MKHATATNFAASRDESTRFRLRAATNDVENVAEMFTAGIVALITDLLRMIGVAVLLPNWSGVTM